MAGIAGRGETGGNVVHGRIRVVVVRQVAGRAGARGNTGVVVGGGRVRRVVAGHAGRRGVRSGKWKVRRVLECDASSQVSPRSCGTYRMWSGVRRDSRVWRRRCSPGVAGRSRGSWGQSCNCSEARSLVADGARGYGMGAGEREDVAWLNVPGTRSCPRTCGSYRRSSGSWKRCGPPAFSRCCSPACGRLSRGSWEHWCSCWRWARTLVALAQVAVACAPASGKYAEWLNAAPATRSGPCSCGRVAGRRQAGVVHGCRGGVVVRRWQAVAGLVGTVCSCWRTAHSALWQSAHAVVAWAPTSGKTASG